MKYISRGVNLDEEVWAALVRLRTVHGSYNKALRHMLTAGGVFKAKTRRGQPNTITRTGALIKESEYCRGK